MFRKWKINRNISRLIHGNTEAIRCKAARELGLLADAGAIGPLVLATVDEHPQVRLAAAEALSALGHEKWLAWVKGDADDFSRLGRDADEGAATALVSGFNLTMAFQDGTCTTARVWALAGAVARSGYPGAFDVLLSGLNSTHETARSAAAYGLGILRDVRAVEPIVEALETTDVKAKGFRLDLVGALGELRDARAVNVLVKALPPVESLGGLDADVSKKAATALAAIGDRRAVFLVAALLKNYPLCDCPEVVRALGDLGDERAIAPLMELFVLLAPPPPTAKQRPPAGLAKTSGPVAEAFLGALQRMHGAEATDEAMARGLRSWHIKIRVSIVEALGRIRGDRAIDRLTRMSSDGDPEVREAAAKALVQANGPPPEKNNRPG